ncbi:MAG: hypothetical protein HZB31_14425 [Nitrospirae bacterium]|nr:hypothetical protein [Nitrospirota bacterium]
MKKVSCLAAMLLLIFSIFAGTVMAQEAPCQYIEDFLVTITADGSLTPQTSLPKAAAEQITDCWSVCFPYGIYSNYFGLMNMSRADLNTSRNEWGALGNSYAPIMFYGEITHYKKIQADGMDLSGGVYKALGIYSPEGCNYGSAAK